LTKEGLTIRDRWNKLKPHPLVSAELAYREQLTRIYASLGLDENEVASKTAQPRPGTLGVIRGGREE
jgi:phage terminase small subunit